MSNLSLTETRYKEHISPSMTRLLKFSGFYAEEVSANGVYIYDEKGNEYLDCSGGYGVFILGHRHPEVVSAVKDQIDKMPMLSHVFFNPVQAELAEKLANKCGGGLQYCFFCNSGTEAVEGAIKIARLATGKTTIISTKNAFHGKTMGSLSVSGREMYKKGCDPLLPGTIQIPYNDAEALEKTIDEHTAAFICEPIQGEGGINVPDEDFFIKVKKICSDKGILFVADEIQSGMGRTGKFLALDHCGIKPDMVLLAKGLGGGIAPIGAIVATKQVWQPFFKNPTIHTSTFGGNQLACRAGLATLEVLEKENLIENANELGKYFISGLKEIKSRHEKVIADVRGIGLMIGVETVEEKYGGYIIYEMAKAKITAVYTLNNQKVIRFEPALIIKQEQIDRVLKSFEEAVTKAEKALSK